MRCFRKLIIENFQSHAYTEIDFVPGLNVFVGPSDSGKSSVLRALRWVLFNQPRGAEFIRTGATKCQVRLQLDDGTEIVRIRGKSINRYVLRTPDGQEEVYESLGSGPHPMILQAHQMFPLAWDQKEQVIQFGSQLDSPFLLSESGGSKAKLIGRISGAHWIDLALKETTRERNQLSGEMRQIEKQKEALKEKLAPYENVPQLEESMKLAEQLYQQARQTKQKLEQLMHLSEKLQTIQAEKQKQQELLAQFNILAELEQRHWQNEQRSYQLRSLKKLAQKWQYIQTETEKSQEILQQTKSLSEIETTFIHMGDKKARLVSLKQMSERWQAHQIIKAKNQQQMNKLQTLPKAIEKYEQLLHVQDRMKRLQAVQKAWQQLQQGKQVHVEMMRTTDKLIQWTNERRDEFQQAFAKYQQLSELSARYQKTKKQLTVGGEYLQDRIREMGRYTQQYMELLKKLGKCPTCGSLVDSSLLEHLEEELYGGAIYAAAGRADENDKTKVGKG